MTQNELIPRKGVMITCTGTSSIISHNLQSIKEKEPVHNIVLLGQL